MEYEINDGTLALIPIPSDNPDEESKSKILEGSYEYVVDVPPYEVMDHSCRYFGSSYQGRKDGAKEMLGINYKIPIMVEDSNNIIMFPTSSPLTDQCMWISMNKIKSIREAPDNATLITFHNDIKLVVPVSHHSISNQMMRSRSLESVLRQRKSKY